MHTIKQIIENQKEFKSLMLDWLTKDLKETKKKLFEIESEDDYIKEQVLKLKKRLKNTSYKTEIDKLFFMHPRRNKNFYAWWDKNEQEVVILNYGKN